MSGYFARLALRSGALPFAPRPSSSAQAPEAAGIVEQENVLELPASPAVDVPARVPTSSSERTATASIPSLAQSTPAAAGTASPAPSVMRGDAPAVKSASPRAPDAPHGEPMTVQALPTLNASPTNEVSRRMANFAAPSSAPAQSAEHGAPENGASTPTPRLDVIDDRRDVVRRSAIAPRTDRRIPHRERPSSHPPVVSREIASAHPSAQPVSETREYHWSHDIEISPATAKVERVETLAQAPAATGRTTESSRTALTQNIDVHIGAVRLEIHGHAAPTSTPPAASAPARAAEERPRFAPRRYYLRG